MLRLEGVKGNQNHPLSWVELGGLGWTGVEWVWRGYIFGYKKAVLAFLGEMGFS